MSFCSEIKNALSKIKLENRYDKECELYGYLHSLSTVALKDKGEFNLIFETENSSIARRIFSLVKDIFGMNLEIAAKRNYLRKGHYLYYLTILSSDNSKIVLDYFDLIDFSTGFEINESIDINLLAGRKEISNYLRAIFLSGGYVVDPRKAYSLEFVLSSERYAEDLRKLFEKNEIILKLTKRKEHFVLYTKDSEMIVNILGVIGAYNAVLEIESTMVVKEVRNNINRRINCETANIDKTVTTAMRQVSAIKKVVDKYGITFFDEPLRTLASLRLENEDASLIEIAEMFDPPKSKSTVNNWFKRIEKIAEEI